MKKIVNLVLIVTLLLSFFSGTSLAEEKRVLTVGDVNDNTMSWNNWKMIKRIEEELGIDIQYTYYDADAFAAILASGDLPDLVYPGNMLNYIREADLAMNVAPYLEEYCPNALHDAISSTIKLYKKILYNDKDEFYFFPANIGKNGFAEGPDLSSRGYVVRWDYYKELGCPKITNDEEYLEVLVQMQANHPTTDDGYPTYIYGTDNWRGYDTAFRRYMSLNYWGLYLYENNIFTNDVFDGYLDTEHSMWWSATEWYHKLYNAGKDNGTFDMDLFTQTNDEFKLKRDRGQYMGMHNGNDSLYNAEVVKNPDTLAGYVTIPDAPSNYYVNVNMIMGNGSMYMGFISKNSENYDLALQVINYFYSTDFMREAYMGEQGVTWDYDENGVPQMNEYGKEQFAASRDPSRNNESNYYYNLGGRITNATGYNDNIIHPKDGYPLNFYTLSREYSVEHMNGLYKDVAEWYGVELPMDAVYAAGNFDFRNDCGEAIDSLMSTALDSDQLKIITSAQEILDSYQADLIMCESQEEFDALKASILEEIAATGEADVFAAYQAEWNRIRDIMVPILTELNEANGIPSYTAEQYGDLAK